MTHTMTALRRADSRVPRASSREQSSTTTSAGMFTTPPAPGGWLIASGSVNPKSASVSSLRYCPQLTATVDTATPYSRIRHQATRYAAPSPREA